MTFLRGKRGLLAILASLSLATIALAREAIVSELQYGGRRTILVGPDDMKFSYKGERISVEYSKGRSCPDKDDADFIEGLINDGYCVTRKDITKCSVQMCRYRVTGNSTSLTDLAANTKDQSEGRSRQGSWPLSSKITVEPSTASGWQLVDINVHGKFVPSQTSQATISSWSGRRDAASNTLVDYSAYEWTRISSSNTYAFYLNGLGVGPYNAKMDFRVSHWANGVEEFAFSWGRTIGTSSCISMTEHRAFCEADWANWFISNSVGLGLTIGELVSGSVGTELEWGHYQQACDTGNLYQQGVTDFVDGSSEWEVWLGVDQSKDFEFAFDSQKHKPKYSGDATVEITPC